MKHKTTREFRRLYNDLPQKVKELADKSFRLLKQNPTHPSLRFKKIGKVWSIRVGAVYRALALKDEDGFIWFWIGTHEEYNNIISRCQ